MLCRGDLRNTRNLLDCTRLYPNFSHHDESFWFSVNTQGWILRTMYKMNMSVGSGIIQEISVHSVYEGEVFFSVHI